MNIEVKEVEMNIEIEEVNIDVEKVIKKRLRLQEKK